VALSPAFTVRSHRGGTKKKKPPLKVGQRRLILGLTLAYRPLSAEAQAILRHAVVAQLRDDAAELAELCKEEPLPELPVSMLKLFRLLRRERDRSRRLLALVAKGI
jgi:hypothetical protein